MALNRLLTGEQQQSGSTTAFSFGFLVCYGVAKRFHRRLFIDLQVLQNLCFSF